MLLQSSKFIGAGLAKRNFRSNAGQSIMVWKEGEGPSFYERISLPPVEDPFLVSHLRRLTGVSRNYLDNLSALDDDQFNSLTLDEQLKFSLEEYDFFLELADGHNLGNVVADSISNNWFTLLNLNLGPTNPTSIVLKLYEVAPITDFLVEICGPYI